MPICKQRREGDEYACTCGLRWGLGEEDPHREAKEPSKSGTETLKQLRKDLEKCK